MSLYSPKDRPVWLALYFLVLYSVPSVGAWALTQSSASIAPIRRSGLLRLHAYVPDGLTPEEYEIIKEKERKELAGKNFGAFGPRFAQSSRPTGDWLLNRSLWTMGFSADVGRKEANSSIRFTLAPFVVAMCITLNLYGPYASWLYCRRSTAFCAADITRLLRSRIPVVVAAAATALAGVIPSKKLVERINRRWLWSPRRTSLFTLFVTALWNGISLGASFVFFY